jgi:hypothetical protein
MLIQRRYVITETIERFEILLRDGPLDGRQIGTVQCLLVRARAELAEFDSRCVPAATVAQAVSLIAAVAGLTTMFA